MSVLRFSAFACLLLLLEPALSLADEFNMKIKIDTVRIGKVLLGPELKPEDVKGHVVLVYFWGAVDCPPCLAAMPAIARYNDELGPFGLVVIAPHAQNSTPENMKARAKAHGANFTVAEQGTNVLVNGRPDFDFKPLPHCIVYDQTGQCVYRGLPDTLEPILRRTVGKYLAGQFEGDPAKPVAPLLDSLKKGQPPAGILQKAVSLAKSSDSNVSEQAKALVGKLTAAAEKMAAEMEAQKSSDPVAAYTRAVRFSTDFKGTPPATKAAEIVAELKKDKAVVEDAKARPALEKIRNTDEVLTKALGIDDPKGKEFHKAQASTLRQLQSEIRAMKKSWPDAPSTKEALEIADKYGLTVK